MYLLGLQPYSAFNFQIQLPRYEPNIFVLKSVWIFFFKKIKPNRCLKLFILFTAYTCFFIKTWILLHIFFNPRYNYFSRIWFFFSIFKQKATGTVRSAQSENPGEGIVKTAIELDADMIIMGSRGLGTIRRTILGSVSDYVVHHANVPVVVCPPSWFRMWITRDWNY